MENNPQFCRKSFVEIVRGWMFSRNPRLQSKFNNFKDRQVHKGDVLDWEFLADNNLAQGFADFLATKEFSGNHWVALFEIKVPILMEMVREFFCDYSFDSVRCAQDPEFKGIKFRLGGSEWKLSLYELGWHCDLYSRDEDLKDEIIEKLRNCTTEKNDEVVQAFWPSIGDGPFATGSTPATMIRDPKIRLAHRCLTMSLTIRPSRIGKITELDLFFLYSIFGEGGDCNVPFWIASFFDDCKSKQKLVGGMLVSTIARNLEFLTESLVDAMTVVDPPHVYKMKSLKDMKVIDTTPNGTFIWATPQPDTIRESMEEGGQSAQRNDETDREEIVSMEEGDWRAHQANFMERQVNEWDQLHTWKAKHEARAEWRSRHMARVIHHISAKK